MILVADRGEIACRVIRTLRRMGLGAVAVYSDADRGAPHIDMATDAVRLGTAHPADSYLRGDRIIAAAKDTGAKAIHPGYGFLAEQAEFAEAVEDAGLSFIGPTPSHLQVFGQKHIARCLAAKVGVPLLAGSEILDDAEQALREAERIGYPVMLKATCGGGGTGIRVCGSQRELAQAFDVMARIGAVYVERYLAEARHVEVQVFGDGAGEVMVLGERDCSIQRRNQKLIEESPAPHLSAGSRRRLHADAQALMTSVDFRSAGTVEFLVDPSNGRHHFLEVNPRLQVEHGVTETVFDIDLVEWMVRLADGDRTMFATPLPLSRGHAIQARIYAENPVLDHQPSPGMVTNVRLPEGVRCDGWIAAGTEVTPYYDPLLMKVIAYGSRRDTSVRRLYRALGELQIDGVATNAELLHAVLANQRFASGEPSTDLLQRVPFAPSAIEVVDGGAHTLVVAAPGRIGHWFVGVPPSGPMDARSLGLGNRVLGNPDDAAGLECTVSGPTLRFHHATTICLTGADMAASIAGEPVPLWQAVDLPAGAVLQLDRTVGRGARTYICVRGGVDVPEVLGSRTTFDLGGFGGHAGRALAIGDLLPIGPEPDSPTDGRQIADDEIPNLSPSPCWELAVIEGPHAAPDYLTDDDVALLYATEWEVHYNSARTGVRLIGPKLSWARDDGGDAGLHPSNIHDNAYAVGTVNFTGDMPVILGPDGPSLGGFVCPATVTDTDLWKLGQLRAGDKVRFRPVRSGLGRAQPGERSQGQNERLGLRFRRSGDRHLLVEVGEPVLDLDLRVRVHQLATWLTELRIPGITDLTPGIRSLQVQVDGERLTVEHAAELVQRADAELPGVDDVVLPSRIVHLPLSWNDPAVRKAIEIYMRAVRPDAPWCPSNLEFIRRVNGLDSIDQVREIAFAADYLVYGLGDVYLGAPVATPLDPRHRLVTTKYNPARTWTPENAVGIGGAYLCVYGMEGPGGYQFIGRTTQMWQRWPAEGETPWLLRFFDRIRFYPVDPDQLLELRVDSAAGRWRPEIEQGTLSVADHHAFLDSIADHTAHFRQRQQCAFAAERAAWKEQGEFASTDIALPRPQANGHVDVPNGALRVTAPLTARVWTVDVAEGDRVDAGTVIAVLEAMKTETVIRSPVAGAVAGVHCSSGDLVAPGRVLAVVQPS